MKQWYNRFRDELSYRWKRAKRIKGRWARTEAKCPKCNRKIPFYKNVSSLAPICRYCGTIMRQPKDKI